MKMLNNNLLVELIEVKPIEKRIIQVPSGNNPYERYDEHPFKAKILAVPENYTINGILFPCEIKEGDEVYIKSSAYRDCNMDNEEKKFTIKNKTAWLIRYQDLVAVK
jgi:co-chaperonin GroES (HSP10)